MVRRRGRSVMVLRNGYTYQYNNSGRADRDARNTRTVIAHMERRVQLFRSLLADIEQAREMLIEREEQGRGRYATPASLRR